MLFGTLTTAFSELTFGRLRTLRALGARLTFCRSFCRRSRGGYWCGRSRGLGSFIALGALRTLTAIVPFSIITSISIVVATIIIPSIVAVATTFAHRTLCGFLVALGRALRTVWLSAFASFGAVIALRAVVTFATLRARLAIASLLVGG